MRKIRLLESLIFLSLQSLVWLSLWGLVSLATRLPIHDSLLAIVNLLVIAVSYFLINAIIYRIFIGLFPIQEGYILPKSTQERIYHIHVLFYLMCFYMYLRSNLVPGPFTRNTYRALGAKIGENTYPAGPISDAIFVTIGDYCVIGADSKIIPHALEGLDIGHFPIKIGNRVTLGVNSVVLGGTVIGDDAIVAAGAIVKKGTVIGAGEIWAGIPARKIGVRNLKGEIWAEIPAEKMGVRDL